MPPALDATEIATCLAHWDEMIVKQRALSFSTPSRPREILREAVEENTGEKFTFVEPLETTADFVPDLAMADAGLPVEAGGWEGRPELLLHGVCGPAHPGGAGHGGR